MRAPALTALTLLTACTTDHALVQRIKTEMTRYTRALHRQEPAPEPQEPLPSPWQKGQYVVWATTLGDKVTLTEAQIEEADAQAVIVMITTVSPKLRTTSRLTFTQQPHTRAEAKSYLTQIIRRRGDERPLTYRFHRDMRVDMRDALEPLWATLVPEAISDAPPETAHAIAATMQGCRPGHGLFLASPLGLELRALLHPSVPINGLVSGKAATGETVEVVDLGWAGGAPAL
ncbi:MAG: hypothetical protein IPJ65_41995 [Archangiaceae bacterium]|nr:hypothetical protein [Archangiaceae bacterium]